MKNKLLRMIGAIVLALTVALAATACAPKDAEPTFELKDSTVWLDRYGEQTVELTSGDLSAITFTSADETIATVTAGGLIVATGKGETTVTATSGNYSVEIDVKVRDSGAKPIIKIADNATAYIGIESDIPASIMYNGEAVNFDGTFTASVDDTEIAEVVNGKLKGKKEGTTDFTVGAQYKGLSLTKKGELTVRQSSFVNLEAETADVYKAKGSKLESYEIDASVIYHGAAVENPSLKYEITSGNAFISLDGNKITAVEEGAATVRVTYAADTSIFADLSVIVHPNYIEDHFNPNLLFDTQFGPYTGDEEIGGRKEGLYRFNVGTLSVDDKGWTNYWDHRVEANSNGESIVEMYRKGYRYFAYDLYYTSDKAIYLGQDKANPQSMALNEVFSNDFFMIIENGKITNRPVKNRWITVAFDLYAYVINYPSMLSGFFFTCEDEVNDCYLTNVRYYLDDTFITDKNETVFEQKDGYVQASLNEFVIQNQIDDSHYQPYDGTVGGADDTYVYTGRTNSAWNNALIVKSSMGSSYAAGIGGLKEHGNLFAFDLYIETFDTASNLYFVLNHTNQTFSPRLSQTNVTTCDWLYVIQGENQRYTFEKDVWQTVVIDFGNNIDTTAWRASLMFGTSGSTDVMYIRNIRYYEDDSFIPDSFTGKQPPRDVATKTEGATVEIVEEGEFEGMTKYVNNAKGTDWDNYVVFTEVTGTELKPHNAFFGEGYKYVVFDTYLENSVSSVQLQAYVTSTSYFANVSLNSTAYSSKYYFYDRDTKEAVFNLKSGTWYTVYIPVEYTSATLNRNWSSVYFMVSGPNDDNNPATAYIDNVKFENTNPYDVGELFTAHSAVTLSAVTSGEHAGEVKYENRDGGNSSSWESNVQFFSIRNGKEFFNNSYKYFALDVYLDSSNITGITVQGSTNSAAGQVNIAPTWKVNEAKPAGIYAYYADGTPVTTLERNKKFKLIVPVSYGSNITWTGIYFMVNGGSAETPTVSYISNVEFMKGPGNYLITDVYAGACDNAAEKATVELVTSGDFAGTAKVSSSYTRSQNGAGWDAGNARFTPNDSNGVFYKYKYTYLVFDIYLENATALRFEKMLTLGGTALSPNANKTFAVGSAVDETDVFFVRNTDGTAVTELETGKWYTVAVNIVHNNSVPNWTFIGFMADGGNAEAPSVAYVRNVDYTRANPFAA